MKDDLKQILEEFKSLADKSRANHSQRFFKTGKGEYGEGDIFLGIRVPIIRQFARTHANLPLEQIQTIIQSPYHEERLLAVIMLVSLAKKADDKLLKSIYSLYLKNTNYINNWDIVDVSAPDVVGRYLWQNDRKILFKLARSKNLWKKRISIISTYYFIRERDYNDTLALAEILLNDTHDLIHKACGWMLREIGNRDIKTEELFLKKHYQQMPRTMLRYAIEKFPEDKRKKYLQGSV